MRFLGCSDASKKRKKYFSTFVVSTRLRRLNLEEGDEVCGLEERQSGYVVYEFVQGWVGGRRRWCRR